MIAITITRTGSLDWVGLANKSSHLEGVYDELSKSPILAVERHIK